MNEKKSFMILNYYLIEKAWDYTLYIACGLILLFLVAPLFAIIPLSFNSEPFFTFPMPGVSTQWYEALFASSKWQHAAQLTFGVAFSVMVIATCLGTLAALGITFADFPMKGFVIGLFLSPLMVPHLIVGLGMFFFYAWVGVVYTPWGLILAHTVLATPFVVLTVTATLTNFNVNLMRAGSSLGAGPIAVFFRIMLPVILPGVVGGAVLAFVASFDELIIAILISGPEYKTIPRQMWSGVREELSPVVTAAATVLISFSIVIMGFAEWLRRRTVRLRTARFQVETA
jgi:putative spermidine/putrescine transport system permease protein